VLVGRRIRNEFVKSSEACELCEAVLGCLRVSCAYSVSMVYTAYALLVQSWYALYIQYGIGEKKQPRRFRECKEVQPTCSNCRRRDKPYPLNEVQHHEALHFTSLHHKNPRKGRKVIQSHECAHYAMLGMPRTSQTASCFLRDPETSTRGHLQFHPSRTSLKVGIPSPAPQQRELGIPAPTAPCRHQLEKNPSFERPR
jgi:hypothetical protein